MRVTILGIDGLDYDIVEELNLENLKQKEYGKLNIPDECFIRLGQKDAVPYTPLCWFTIITGRLPPKHVQTPRALKHPIVESIRQRLGFIKGKKRVFRKLGFKAETGRWGNLARPYKTIFDLTRNSIDINVPTYSKDWALSVRTSETKKQVSLKEYLSFIENEHANMMQSLAHMLNSYEYDLLMAYTRLLDAYGHVYYGHQRLHRVYVDMDNFVGTIKNSIKGPIVMVSDHGFTKLKEVRYGGRHSTSAFYSTNTEHNAEIKDLTNIYSLVEELLDKP